MNAIRKNNYVTFPGETLACLRKVGIAIAAFFVEYVVVFVVSEKLIEIDVASDTDHLAAGVTAAAHVDA